MRLAQSGPSRGGRPSRAWPHPRRASATCRRLLIAGLVAVGPARPDAASAADSPSPSPGAGMSAGKATGRRQVASAVRRASVEVPGDLPQALPSQAADPSTTPRPPSPPADADRPAPFAGPLDPESIALESRSAAAQLLTLPQAIDLAFRTQPKLRAQLEAIEQARGLKGIAYSAFLPTVQGKYRAGGVDLHTGQGKTNTLGSGSGSGQTSGGNFSALPGLGVVPGSLRIESAFELAELEMQWLILDFGRRLATYDQARLAGDIAQLQTSRAFQTVANDVAVAYYGVLQARALRRTASAGIRRAAADLADARKLKGEGAAMREEVLEAEVLVAESRQTLRTVAEDEFVALASLNLAIGLKGDGCVDVTEPPGITEWSGSLADCLETAARRRVEFQVARRSVEIASAGTRVARADFAPKVAAAGSLFNLQQASPTIFADQVVGFIGVEWKLFEGGRKVATLRVADSRLREAMAQAESIANTITFQANEAFRRLVAARTAIDDAWPAVNQAEEKYRLVRARAREGNATPAEITTAQAAATRAAQTYYSSIYSYLTAYARLEYALGTGPSSAPRPQPAPGAGAPR